VPRASNSNGLLCQTSITTPIGAKRLSAPLSNHSPLPPKRESRQLEFALDPGLPPITVERAGEGRAGTIRIILESVNRHGRSSASLPDGTILVGSSRQPFLDAARVLIAAGNDPDSWLEAWRPGATAFALRGRLRIAGALTVDETKTAFAKWKAFSSSAVDAGIGYSEGPATTLALGVDQLPQPGPDQSIDTLSRSAAFCSEEAQ
jgi:hypothetical protein